MPIVRTKKGGDMMKCGSEIELVQWEDDNDWDTDTMDEQENGPGGDGDD